MKSIIAKIVVASPLFFICFAGPVFAAGNVEAETKPVNVEPENKPANVEAEPKPAKTFQQYCADEFKEKGECPDPPCKKIESETKEAAVVICLPKPCINIPADKCPKEYCEEMTDCSNKKICHFKMTGGQPKCGDLAYAGQDVPCCKGLVPRCGIEFLDGNCDMEGKNSVFNLPICIPCGDGICTNFENRCNCPEDCGVLPEK